MLDRENPMSYQTILMVLIMAPAILLTGCTTTDPYTGEQVVDQTATAALIGGLALGTAAGYAAGDDDDDDDDDYNHDRRYRRHYRAEDQRDRTYSPSRGIVCYDRQSSCFRNGDYSQRWSRRVYGRN
jgi:hypothetical protein